MEEKRDEKRIVLTTETHEALSELRIGFKGNFDDVVKALIEEVADAKNRVTVGKELRQKYGGKQE